VALLIFCGLATWRLVLRGRRKIIEAKKVAIAEHDMGGKVGKNFKLAIFSRAFLSQF
jgi:hypothetical protein